MRPIEIVRYIAPAVPAWAIYCVIGAAILLYKSSNTKNYIEIDGMVLALINTSGDGRFNSVSKGVRYRYEFRGRKFESNKYDVFSGSHFKGSILPRVNDSLKVYVDPDAPENSVISLSAENISKEKRSFALWVFVATFCILILSKGPKKEAMR